MRLNPTPQRGRWNPITVNTTETYVTTFSGLIESSPLERQSLEEIVKATYRDGSNQGVKRPHPRQSWTS